MLPLTGKALSRMTSKADSLLLFGRQFGEIIKDRPTITIPDDHDVYHGNLWGAGGRQAKFPEIDPQAPVARCSGGGVGNQRRFEPPDPALVETAKAIFVRVPPPAPDNKSKPQGELVGTNSLGEPIHASPAAVDGALYYRTESRLWKIAQEN